MNDGYGNVTDGTWAAILDVWGDLRFERGVERLRAGRIESAVSGNLRVRASPDSRRITAGDRVVIDGEVYNIQAAMEPPRSGMIEMTVERGGAV